MDTTDEAQIRQQLGNWKAAFEASDIEKMMSFYAPEIVAFDLMPPIEFVGEDAWRANWVNFFEQFDGNPILELENVEVYCSGDIAFNRGFTRLKGTMQGQPMDMWVRQTNCFHRIDGAWLIIHDHVSVPVDFSTGMALTDLTP